MLCGYQHLEFLDSDNIQFLNFIENYTTRNRYKGRNGSWYSQNQEHSPNYKGKNWNEKTFHFELANLHKISANIVFFDSAIIIPRITVTIAGVLFSVDLRQNDPSEVSA